MLKRLLGKAPVDVWVIKQIDDDLLHLCGQGVTQANARQKTVLAALEAGSYSGAVQMSGGGVVLIARLFDALVPIEALQLLPDGQARWQGREWLVAQVPQRCWAFKGKLIAQASPLGGSGLASSEDVSGIRRQAEKETPRVPGQVVFRPENANEDPLVVPKEGPTKGPRPRSGREWRKD
ncbi:hypothetical protein [Halomonas sp.]|jgi:hypothetical protein|uniref:hypothetical protein n=1 Tax=Halomonas sp. TaxID=1486246 RepID=UPI00356786C2